MDPVTICNMALGMLGQNRITSIEEANLDSDEAELCATFFDPTVRFCLEARAWLFATGFVNLGARQDSPYKIQNVGGDRPLLAMFPFDPAVIIRPLGCDDGSGTFRILWERNGTNILSEDTDTLLLKCIQYLNDPTKWTPTFGWAVAHQLAATIAGPLTHSASLEDEMLKKYEGRIKEAASLDGMAGSTNQQFMPGASSLANRRR